MSKEHRERKPLRDGDRVFGSTARDQVEWVKSDFFCYECGKQDCWQMSHEGSGSEDYYHQCTVTCHSCDSVMCCVAGWQEWDS